MNYERASAAGTAHYPSVSIKYLHCGTCGRLFASRRADRKACGQDCDRARKAADQRARYAIDPSAARERVANLRLRPEIAAKAKTARRAWRERVGYIESTRAADQRRRARKAAVPTENINAWDVYERDGWVCGICHEPVDAGLAWPDPLSPSLDHVVPLSAGGPHVMSNVRLAHLSCNVRRGTAPDGVLAS